MIERYWGKDMKALWKTNEKKFGYWLKVELAVLEARESLGQIPPGTTEECRNRTWMDEHVAKAIERRDKEIRHDLNAFIEIMRCQLIASRDELDRFYMAPDTTVGDEYFNERVAEILSRQGDSPLAGWFHDGMTSYDTEEPAMALLLEDSSRILQKGFERLIAALTDRAHRHRGQLMIGRTHGQHAQPITFGVKLLNYRNQVTGAALAVNFASVDLEVMKLSGAVGMYGTLSPAVETRVGELLHLTPIIATQIISLERRARLVSEMAITASVLEHIVQDLWLMSQTEVGEIREAFSKKQKGSSAMPHKKNPITIEKIRGLSRAVRGYAMAMMENVATAHERDISHSSVERLVMVDAFGILDHMLTGLADVIETMEVFPDRMAANLEKTFGTIASQRVEMWLKERGMPAEAAYRAVQRACAQAMGMGLPLENILYLDEETAHIVREHADGLRACFDWKTWVAYESYIYDREFETVAPDAPEEPPPAHP